MWGAVRVVRRRPRRALRNADELGPVHGGSDLGCTDPKAFLGEDLVMIDVDQSPGPVACPARAGPG